MTDHTKPVDLIAERPDAPFQPGPSRFDPWQREALRLRQELDAMTVKRNWWQGVALGGWLLATALRIALGWPG